jgi:hypothetical protein
MVSTFGALPLDLNFLKVLSLPSTAPCLIFAFMDDRNSIPLLPTHLRTLTGPHVPRHDARLVVYEYDLPVEQSLTNVASNQQ